MIRSIKSNMLETKNHNFKDITSRAVSKFLNDNLVWKQKFFPYSLAFYMNGSFNFSWPVPSKHDKFKRVW